MLYEVITHRGRPVSLERAALHEQPLGRAERRERLRLGAQRGEFGGDAEEFADEGVECGREAQQQLGLRLRAEGVGRGARGAERGGGVGIEEVDEGGVEANEAVARVEVIEAEAETRITSYNVCYTKLLRSRTASLSR